MPSNFDVAIIGAGPVGLCFAKALSDSGLKVIVIERENENTLSSPAFDGREIALTHQSAELMKKLGLWERISNEAISALRDARVFNGSSLISFDIGYQDTKKSELGYLVSNHLIRKAAYESVKSSPAIMLKTGAEVTHINNDISPLELTLDNGEIIQTQLLIGADSRYSATRRAMGIAAEMHDFGKTMLVCVMEHPVPHENIAWEWFDYGQTLALLPMNGMRSSVVITLPPNEMNSLKAKNEVDFNREVTLRFKYRLGNMQLMSTRHAYPLITVYSKRLVGKRFALIGDAAVGMHPVTAHGFNFGLKGISTLIAEIKTAISYGQDIASKSVLERYEQKHRRDTRPLFFATHAIAKVYGENHPPARLIRTAAIRIGRHLKPFKHAVAGFLADA